MDPDEELMRILAPDDCLPGLRILASSVKNPRLVSWAPGLIKVTQDARKYHKNIAATKQDFEKVADADNVEETNTAAAAISWRRE